MAVLWMLVCLVMIFPCPRSLELHDVPVVHEASPDLAMLAAQRQPYVLTSLDLVRQWPARNWTLAHVTSQLPIVPAYMQRESSRFRTFHDDKELEPYLTKDRWTAFNTQVNVRTTWQGLCMP